MPSIGELRKFHCRIAKRNLRHPKWRQVYIDCDGICQEIKENGGLCGSVSNLEFHEIFGEDHNGDGRMQQRTLRCWNCHYAYHDMTHQPSLSVLTEDINYEINREGGYQNWLTRYGLHTNNGNSGNTRT